jgi:hypothetical protein
VYFLSAETPAVADFIQQAHLYPAIVRSERTDEVLHHTTCSAERSGYFIYEDNKKFVLNQ